MQANLSQQAKLDVEIRQTEARNSYLKKNLEMMKQALEDKIADEQTSQARDSSTKLMKQLDTVTKNIAITQKELSKVKDGTKSLEELMKEALELEQALREKEAQRKLLVNEILKVKKQLFLKHREIDNGDTSKLKVESCRNQIRVLNKKLQLLSHTAKPSPSALLQPLQTTKNHSKLQLTDHSNSSRMAKEQLSLYSNLTQSYTKKLQQLQHQVQILESTNKSRERQASVIDHEIDEWIAKIDELKKHINPQLYRKSPQHEKTEKKLVKLI